MTASPPQIGVLTYASPQVRSSPPRTLLRMLVGALGWCLAALFRGIRLIIMLSGYAVLAAGIVLRFAFSALAMILLFLGGVRWQTVKRRTLAAAQWVDAKVLNVMAFFRRRLLPRSAGDVAR